MKYAPIFVLAILALGLIGGRLYRPPPIAGASTPTIAATDCGASPDCHR
jgi:hypothetical protein